MKSAAQWAALAFLALATVGLAIAFPLTYVFTCGPNKRLFLGDAPPQLKKLVRNDADIVQPNGCNVCPAADQVATWISPGDVCDLPGYDPGIFDHCNPSDEHDFENDFDPDHHFKACLTKEELDHLWTTGHCHDTDTTQPFVAPDGLLICKAGKCNATRADGSNHTVEDGSRCDNNRDCCERSSCSSKFFGKQDKICLHDDDHDDDAVIVNAHREGCGHEYQYCDKDADCCSPNGCHKPSAYRGFTESGYSGYSNQCGGIALRLALRDSGAAVPQTARFGDAEGGCGLDGAFCQPYGRYGPKGMPLGRDGGCCVDYYCDVQYGPDAPPGYEPAYPGIEPYPLHWDRPIGSPGTCKLLDDWTTGWTTGWHDPT